MKYFYLLLRMFILHFTLGLQLHIDFTLTYLTFIYSISGTDEDRPGQRLGFSGGLVSLALNTSYSTSN